MIDQGTSFNSSINSSVLSSVSLGSPSTDEPSGVQVATIVVQFDDNNLNVDNKGKEYQQFIVIINMEYQQSILSMTKSYFKSQSSSKSFMGDPRTYLGLKLNKRKILEWSVLHTIITCTWFEFYFKC